MRIAMIVVLAGAMAAPAAGDNLVEQFATFVGAAAGQANGQTLLLVHGRQATGAGYGLQWQLDELPVYGDLAVVVSSRGSTRLVPGLSLGVFKRSAGMDLMVGIAWTPSEYGMMRIGALRTYAAPYVKLTWAMGG